MAITMAKLHVLLPVLLVVLSSTYSTYATPSTFKKMMMRAAADRAQVADQLARERRSGDSHLAPRPKFRTALQMKSLNDNIGHMIEKRAYISDNSKNSKHEIADESPMNMEKRFFGSSGRRRKYGSYSSEVKPKKRIQPKYKKPTSSSNSLSKMSDIISKINKKKKAEEEIANSKSEEEKEEEKNNDDEINNFLAKLLGLGSVRIPEPISEEEEDDEEPPEEEYEVNVKRYDPILFLGKEYHESHADSMVRHLLEKRNIELAEEAEEEAELVQPVEVHHQNALHDRDSGHAKRSTQIGSHLQQRRHRRGSASGHQHTVQHGVSSLMADDNIGRMPFALKHKRSTSRRHAPVKRSPMMLGAKKSLTRF